MQRKFSEITKLLQKSMPYTSAIRNNEESVGAKILNVAGLQFEDIEGYLQYAIDNYHVLTMDEKQVDIMYKARIPKSIKPTMFVEVIGTNRQLLQTHELKNFYDGIDNRFLERKQVYYPNPFFIDWSTHIIYTRYSYDVSEEFKEGKVRLRIYSEDRSTIVFEHDVALTIHHVWNFFDEFGLIVDLPRNYGERNTEYKKRLLDVFLHKPNSSRMGMINNIANELGLRKSIKRAINETGIYPLEYTNVEVDSLRLERTNVWENIVYNIDDGEIELDLRNIYEAGEIAQIDFVSGIRVHSFYDKDDVELQTLLYDIEGAATPMLKYYIDVISQNTPIMWGDFVWGESFWNVADKEVSGYGAVPTFKDAKFLGWLNYKIGG